MALLSAARVLLHVTEPASVRLARLTYNTRRGFTEKAHPCTRKLDFRDWGVLWSGGLGLAVGLLLSRQYDEPDGRAARVIPPASAPIKTSSGRNGPWIASPIEPSRSWWQPVMNLLGAVPVGRDSVPEDPPLDVSKLSFKSDGLREGGRARPLVLVSCGAFNPPTNMHLRMFHLAARHLQSEGWDVGGGYMSPVNDAYRKPGLVPAAHRVAMCKAAATASTLVMVDSWESQQPQYVRTLHVLQHIQTALSQLSPSNSGQATTTGATAAGQATTEDGSGDPMRVRVGLLCGADLLASMADPTVWLQPLLRDLLSSHPVIAITRGETNVEELLGKEGTLLHEFRDSVILVREHVPNVISSTLLRSELEQGRPIDFLTPAPVVQYISERKLYVPQSNRPDTLL